MNADALTESARSLIGVCTYEEASNIRTLLEGLREAIPTADVLVVDDDSPDGTAGIVQEICKHDSAVRVLVRKQERGLGSAIVRAATQAIEEDYEFFLNLDGDLSHNPQDLSQILAVAIDDPDADVVVGSRYVAGGRIEGWPWHRRLMSRWINRFAVVCLRLPVADCSGSIRCYRVAALRKVELGRLKCQGYALLEELLMRLHQHDCKIREVPITFTDRQQGRSKLTIREAVRSVGFMLRLAVLRKS